MANRSRLAAERMTVSVVRVARAPRRAKVRFVALDGPMVVMIEADGEDDAQALCAEEGLEFVCLCDD